MLSLSTATTESQGTTDVETTVQVTTDSATQTRIPQTTEEPVTVLPLNVIASYTGSVGFINQHIVSGFTITVLSGDPSDVSAELIGELSTGEEIVHTQVFNVVRVTRLWYR